MNRPASFTRNSPEMSLGNSVSRMAARVRDSRSFFSHLCERRSCNYIENLVEHGTTRH